MEVNKQCGRKRRYRQILPPESSIRRSDVAKEGKQGESDDKHLLAASISFDISETIINLTLAGREKDEMLEKRLKGERSGKHIGTIEDTIEIL